MLKQMASRLSPSSPWRAAALSADAQVALPKVLRALVTVSRSGTEPTARAVPMVRFAEGSPERRVVEAFLDPQVRLLVADGDGQHVNEMPELTCGKQPCEDLSFKSISASRLGRPREVDLRAIVNAILDLRRSATVCHL